MSYTMLINNQALNTTLKDAVGEFSGGMDLKEFTIFVNKSTARLCPEIKTELLKNKFDEIDKCGEKNGIITANEFASWLGICYGTNLKDRINKNEKIEDLVNYIEEVDSGKVKVSPIVAKPVFDEKSMTKEDFKESANKYISDILNNMSKIGNYITEQSSYLAKEVLKPLYLKLKNNLENNQ